MAILTEAGVRLMRWLYVEHDVPQRLLAEWFGVGVAAAGYAATGFTWKHVPMYAPQSESP